MRLGLHLSLGSIRATVDLESVELSSEVGTIDPEFLVLLSFVEAGGASSTCCTTVPTETMMISELADI